MCILFRGKNLRALKFKSSYKRFWNVPQLRCVACWCDVGSVYCVDVWLMGAQIHTGGQQAYINVDCGGYDCDHGGLGMEYWCWISEEIAIIFTDFISQSCVQKSSWYVCFCTRSQSSTIKPIYRKTSNISCTLVGKKIVDNSDVVGASPVGAAPTTSSFSTERLASVVWAKTTARRETFKFWYLVCLILEVWW